MRLIAAFILVASLAGCAAAPAPLAPHGAASVAGSAKKRVESKVELKVVGTRGNGYTTRYRLTVDAEGGTVEYTFDDTPLSGDETGPDRAEPVSLKVGGKKIALHDVKAVEAAAKVLASAAPLVETRHRNAVRTAIRALTWDL